MPPSSSPLSPPPKAGVECRYDDRNQDGRQEDGLLRPRDRPRRRIAAGRQRHLAGHDRPHTFSLVTKGSLPKTAKLRKECFTPRKICMGIAGWYGLKGEESPKNPLGDVGSQGWDTMGTATKKGDSYFFGKKDASVEQVVAAKAGTTLYFMCAVHAFMQGSIRVLPPLEKLTAAPRDPHLGEDRGASRVQATQPGMRRAGRRDPDRRRRR